MTPPQRDLAYALAASGLSPGAYRQLTQIIDHEDILGPLERDAGAVTFSRDPLLYYWSVFGDPDGDEPWGWRVEGHHISVHLHAWGDQVISVTPFFFGANPAEVRQGARQGLRILSAREDLAYDLMESLDSVQRAKAVISDRAPWDILTYNSSRVVLPREEGLPASRLSGTQREALLALIAAYVSQVRTDVAAQKLEALREQGIDRIHLAWMGAVERGPGKQHYYRLHGGAFVVEFDNYQNDANHVHSVWRDVENDFSQDVLREHRLLYHVV